MQLINNQNIIRITALWAFSEAFLGGILHGFKIPFSGLFLSFFASVCITLLAVTTSQKITITKATLAVIAVKFMLSPQTPPMAYVAVLIQGLVGELLFILIRKKQIAAALLTFFSLVYSAIQHLLILTLVFGKSFWNAMDTFLNGITKNFVSGFTPYAMYIIIAYLSCYIIVGIIGGIFNAKMVTNIYTEKWKQQYTQSNLATLSIQHLTVTNKKKQKLSIYALVGILLCILFVISYFPAYETIVQKNKVLRIIIRGSAILLTWNFIIAPLFIKLMQNWVSKYQHRHNTKLQQIILLIPEMRVVVQKSWLDAKNYSPLYRIQKFISNMVLLVLYADK